jgi:hypothetical protein
MILECDTYPRLLIDERSADLKRTFLVALTESGRVQSEDLCKAAMVDYFGELFESLLDYYSRSEIYGMELKFKGSIVGGKEINKRLVWEAYRKALFMLTEKSTLRLY